MKNLNRFGCLLLQIVYKPRVRLHTLVVAAQHKLKLSCGLYYILIRYKLTYGFTRLIVAGPIPGTLSSASIEVKLPWLVLKSIIAFAFIAPIPGNVCNSKNVAVLMFTKAGTILFSILCQCPVLSASKSTFPSHAVA